MRTYTRLAMLAVLVFFAAAACPADTFYVRQNGNDQADGKTAKTAFRSAENPPRER